MSALSRRSFRSSSRLLFRRSYSSSGVKALGDPPIVHSRRVVVTGLGMVSPLGCGVETTWNRLLKGECGIRSLTTDDLKMHSFDRETQLYTYEQLSSKVAAVVPCGTKPHEFNEELWLNSK
ncbi:3-oxoacyl-[acyl-carrier-protein] synthase, mitochondrial, partial [Morus notabilis]